MRPTKFQVSWPFGSGEEAKLDFQDDGHGGHLGFSIGTIYKSPPMLPTVSSQLVQGCRRSRLLKHFFDAAQRYYLT